MKSPLRELWSHFKKQQRNVVVASVFSILNKIFDIAPPLLIGLAVDTVVKRSDSFVADLGITDHLEQMYFLGFLTFLIWALESFFEYLFKVKWRAIAQAVQHSFRMEAYSHLQKLELSFFENQSTGNLTAIMNDDVNQLERFLDVGANDILQTLTTVLTIGSIFFYISPTIALLSFLPIPVILWGSFYYQKKVAPHYAAVREEAGMLSSMIVNNLSGMATIKSYVAQDFEYQRIQKQSLTYEHVNRNAIKLSSSFSPLIRMVVLCGFLFTLVLGGIYVFEGKLGVGPYSTLIFLVQRLLWPMTRLGETFDLYQRASSSIKRILTLIRTPIQVKSGHKHLNPDDIQGHLAIKNLSFAYDKDHEILRDLSLDIKPGETVAFVGTTGSGKSTLIKLLLRFYDATKGSIEIDSTPVTELDLNSLRKSIGLVSQDTYLFHGTVKENILYGSFNKSMEDVEYAAKMARAFNFIQELPYGFETIVGERGQKLSGGQRQRISLARALIKNPSLYIFDEATSAIDNETEAQILQSLKEVTKDKTTIMVAHRLSTIMHAHRIVVLENGRIIEQGSHEELISHRGPYFALWSVQSGQS